MSIELFNELEISIKQRYCFTLENVKFLCPKVTVKNSALFYEADDPYIGSKVKKSYKQELLEQAAFLVMLSTDKENKYPKFTYKKINASSCR